MPKQVALSAIKIFKVCKFSFLNLIIIKSVIKNDARYPGTAFRRRMQNRKMLPIRSLGGRESRPDRLAKVSAEMTLDCECS